MGGISLGTEFELHNVHQKPGCTESFRPPGPVWPCLVMESHWCFVVCFVFQSLGYGRLRISSLNPLPFPAPPLPYTPLSHPSNPFPYGVLGPSGPEFKPSLCHLTQVGNLCAMHLFTLVTPGTVARGSAKGPPWRPPGSCSVGACSLNSAQQPCGSRTEAGNL